MAKTKKISVFDTKAQKARLNGIKQSKKYNKNNIKISMVESCISRFDNIKTNTTRYIFFSRNDNKMFKTLDEAIKHKNIYLNRKKVKINKKMIIRTIEKQIKEITSVYGEKTYQATVQIQDKKLIKLSKTIEEARKNRDILIKKQQLTKRIHKEIKATEKAEYNKKYNKHILVERISKQITRSHNLITNNISFTFKSQKINNKFYKSFKTLDKAITFRDNYLKEHP